MTARGELYVDEDCRDAFEKELNEWYGENKWYLKGSPFGDYWDISQMPNFIEVEVVDENRNVIGKVEIRNRFYIEEGNGRYIEIKPSSIKRIK